MTSQTLLISLSIAGASGVFFKSLIVGTCGGIATSGVGLPDLDLELEAFLPSRFFCLSCSCCDSFDDALPLLMTMMMMVVEVMIKIMGNPIFW